MTTDRETLTRLKNRKAGFTLIEVIAVLVLLGILAAIAVPRYVDMAENARNRAIDAGIAELNGREVLVWGDEMISLGGYTDDATTFAALDTDLGADYNWGVAPNVGGGTLEFQTASVALTRVASTPISPGSWSR